MTDIVRDEEHEVVLGSALAQRSMTAVVKTPRPPLGPWLRRRWPRVLAIAVLVVVTIGVLDGLVGGLVHRSRQGQLVADYRTPRNFTATGRALAVMQILKLGMDVIVAEGVDPSTLRGSPGHLPNSVVPGAPGNSVVYGHRHRLGAPFGSIDDLVGGDEIYVQPKGSQDVAVYRVTGVTRGDDDAVLPLLAPVPDAVRLTLVTNAAGRFGGERLVVQAEATTAARRPPAATRATAAPDTVEPGGAVVNLSLLLAAGWLVLGVGLGRGLRRLYAARVRWAVAAFPLLLGACLLWFEIDRWLPATS